MNKWRQYEKPVVTPGNSPTHETVETHPAYAQIRASRVNGGACLYGSDFIHNGYIEITICKSELHRGLSNDYPFGREEMISVCLSEAQWANFVSAMNIGQGTQCTLRHFGMEPAAQIPEPPKRHDQFSRESDETVQKAIEHIKTLRKMIEESSLSQTKKKEMLMQAEFAHRGISSSQDFIGKQFGEHMETVTEAAKTEVNAYILSTVTRAGLDALGVKPIQFEALVGPEASSTPLLDRKDDPFAGGGE